MASAAQAGGADWIHLDIEDGVFVPTFTVGPRVIPGIRRVVRLPLEVHLQTVRPERWLEMIAGARPDRLIVHVEGADDVPRLLDQVRRFGLSVGVALLPESPVHLVEPYVKHVDLVTVVSAGPEDGEFQIGALEKVRLLRGGGSDVEVDGGVTPQVMPLVSRAGASAVVAGRAIFSQGADRVAGAIAALRGAVP
jgi:ribulose-phosphate 3-epimerase